MRQADVDEIRAASGHTPDEALTEGFRVSNICLAAEGRKGELLGIFGVAPTADPLIGSVWFLGNDNVRANTYRFLREAPRWLDRFHDRYPVLMNFVAEFNTLHIRWLRAAGCTFIRRHPHCGAAGIPFLEFVRIKRETRPPDGVLPSRTKALCQGPVSPVLHP